MRRWMGMVLVGGVLGCNILGGSVIAATLLVNDEGKVAQCDDAACIEAQQLAGYVPVPAVTLGIRQAATGEILSVLPGSGAAQAGVQVGDRLVALDGIPIARLTDGVRLLQAKAPGNTVQMTVERGQEHLTLPVVLKRRE